MERRRWAELMPLEKIMALLDWGKAWMKSELLRVGGVGMVGAGAAVAPVCMQDCIFSVCSLKSPDGEKAGSKGNEAGK